MTLTLKPDSQSSFSAINAQSLSNYTVQERSLLALAKPFLEFCIQEVLQHIFPNYELEVLLLKDSVGGINISLLDSIFSNKKLIKVEVPIDILEKDKTELEETIYSIKAKIEVILDKKQPCYNLNGKINWLYQNVIKPFKSLNKQIERGKNVGEEHLKLLAQLCLFLISFPRDQTDKYATEVSKICKKPEFEEFLGKLESTLFLDPHNLRPDKMLEEFAERYKDFSSELAKKGGAFKALESPDRSRFMLALLMVGSIDKMVKSSNTGWYQQVHDLREELRALFPFCSNNSIKLPVFLIFLLQLFRYANSHYGKSIPENHWGESVIILLAPNIYTMVSDLIGDSNETREIAEDMLRVLLGFLKGNPNVGEVISSVKSYHSYVVKLFRKLGFEQFLDFVYSLSLLTGLELEKLIPDVIRFGIYLEKTREELGEELTQLRDLILAEVIPDFSKKLGFKIENIEVDLENPFCVQIQFVLKDESGAVKTVEISLFPRDGKELDRQPTIGEKLNPRAHPFKLLVEMIKGSQRVEKNKDLQNPVDKKSPSNSLGKTIEYSLGILDTVR